MKPLALASILLTAMAAGCGGATLQVRPFDKGSIVDRTMAFQESMLSLVGKSGSPDEAADRIAKYCASNLPSIDRLRADGAKLTEADGEALGRQLAPRMQDLQTRAAEVLEGREALLGHPKVLMAMATCAKADPAAGPTAPPAEPIEPDPAPTPEE